MVGYIMGAVCFSCKEGPLEGFELHEIDQDRWEVFCIPCVLSLELDDGK